MRIAIGSGYEISRVIKGGWHLAGDHGAVDREQALPRRALDVAEWASDIASKRDVSDRAAGSS